MLFFTIRDCAWIVARKNDCIVDMWYPCDKQNAKEKEVLRQELIYSQDKKSSYHIP